MNKTILVAAVVLATALTACGDPQRPTAGAPTGGDGAQQADSSRTDPNYDEQRRCAEQIMIGDGEMYSVESVKTIALPPIAAEFRLAPGEVAVEVLLSFANAGAALVEPDPLVQLRLGPGEIEVPRLGSGGFGGTDDLHNTGIDGEFRAGENATASFVFTATPADLESGAALIVLGESEYSDAPGYRVCASIGR